MQILKDPTLLLRRSVLSVPCDNGRALAKAPSLDCDSIIFDLEDSVSPERKQEARDNLRQALRQPAAWRQERIIRINPLASEFGQADMALVADVLPDTVLIPKVEQVSEVRAVADMLSQSAASKAVTIWAMIETPKGVLNAADIAEKAPRLDCFVVGLNDLRKETGVLPQAGRAYLVPWLMQVVLAARAFGVDVLDSVFNDFKDEAGLEAECIQGRAMGFSGKMLIHPVQIEPANRHFGPDENSLQDAKAIVDAFGAPGAETLNVLTVNGKMVERLHLLQAEALLAKAKLIADRKNAT